MVVQGGKRPPGKVNKNVLACNIILLDGSDLGLEIGVSVGVPKRGEKL